MTSMFKSQSFNHQHFHRLMKLTYQLRRLSINNSSMTVSAIKEEYPYFGNAKWVMKICVYFCTHTYIRVQLESQNLYYAATYDCLL